MQSPVDGKAHPRRTLVHVPSQVWLAPVGFLTGDDCDFAVESIEPEDVDEDP